MPLPARHANRGTKCTCFKHERSSQYFSTIVLRAQDYNSLSPVPVYDRKVSRRIHLDFTTNFPTPRLGRDPQEL